MPTSYPFPFNCLQSSSCISFLLFCGLSSVSMPTLMHLCLVLFFHLVNFSPTQIYLSNSPPSFLFLMPSSPFLENLKKIIYRKKILYLSTVSRTIDCSPDLGFSASALSLSCHATIFTSGEKSTSPMS